MSNASSTEKKNNNHQ